MVRAGQLERLHQADRAECFQACVVELEVFKTPAHLLAGQRLLAELVLGDTHGFDVQNAVDHAEVVIDRAEAFWVGQIALARIDNGFFDALKHRELRARRVRGNGDKTLGGGTGGRGVVFRVAPDVADDAVGRKAHLLRCFQRHRVHHAPTAQNHPVGLLAADVEPLRLLLVAWVRHFDMLDREAVFFGQ